MDPLIHFRKWYDKKMLEIYSVEISHNVENKTKWNENWIKIAKNFLAKNIFYEKYWKKNCFWTR